MFDISGDPVGPAGEPIRCGEDWRYFGGVIIILLCLAISAFVAGLPFIMYLPFTIVIPSELALPGAGAEPPAAGSVDVLCMVPIVPVASGCIAPFVAPLPVLPLVVCACAADSASARAGNQYGPHLDLSQGFASIHSSFA